MLRPTNKNNPCPICENTKGHCRQKDSDPDYWQCMTYADAKKGEIVGSYKCIGITKNQQWAQFKPDNSQEWTEEKRREWKLENQRRNAEKARKLDETRQKSLSATERNKGYTQLLAELELHPDDREDLIKRGFTEEQIILSGFKSVKPYQWLQGEYHNLLPGISYGKKLNARDSGYLCPIRDENGLIIACQLRLRHPSDGGRYRWLSGCDGSLHLNGELPLAVHRPTGKPEGIGFAEGVGAKAFLASQRLNQIIIGAAGGQWANSKVTLSNILNQLSDELDGLKEATFYLDAGDVLNYQVMKRWSQTEKLLNELGWTVKYAWWGQINKGDGDIDEIDLSETKIKYYTPDDFGVAVGERIQQIKVEEAIRKAQEPLRKLTYKPDFILNTRYIPTSIIPILPTTGIIALRAFKGSGKSNLQAALIRRTKEKGRYVLSITPRIALGREQAFKWKITWIGDRGNTRTIVESSQKEDEQIAGLEQELAILSEELRRLEVTPIQLSLLSAERKNAEIDDLRLHIGELEQRIENLQAASFRQLGLCWDSLWKTKRMDMKGALILIDEAEMGFTHLATSDTCRRNRAEILKRLTEILRECLLNDGLVVLADADLTDITVDYVNAQLPSPIKPYVIVNSFVSKETRWKISFRTGSKDTTIDEIVARLKNREYLAVTCDSQQEAEALEKLILKEISGFCSFIKDGEITQQAKDGVPCVIRIDSKMTRCEAGKYFVQHPNEEILKWQPRILIYTPSMGVGVSIDESTKRLNKLKVTVPYFDVVFGLFFGVIEPSQCRQQLARIRVNVPRIVWAVKSGIPKEGCHSFFPDEINRQTKKYRMEGALDIDEIAEANLKESCKTGNSFDDGEWIDEAYRLKKEYYDEDSRLWKNPHIELYAKIKARQNYGIAHLSELLESELREEGHEVSVSAGAKSAVGEEMKGLKDEQKQEKAEGIASAPDETEEEIWEIKKNPCPTPEEEYSVAKFNLKRDVPGIELTPEYVRKAYVDDRGKWLASQKLFFFLNNIDAVKKRDGYSFAKSLSSWAKGTAFAPDCRLILPKVKAIAASGLFDWINLREPEKDYTGSSSEGKAFLKRCIKHKEVMRTALNLSVSEKSSPIDVAQKILRKVGLELKAHGKKENRKYQLNVDLFNDPDRIATLEALQRAWKEVLPKPEEKATPVKEEAAEAETIAFASGDIGKPVKKRRWDGVFGNTAGLSIAWDMGFRLLELPGEFRDSYLLESPEGKRVNAFDGLELMTDEDGAAYCSEIVEKMKASSVEEAIALWGRCEALGESLNISQEIWMKLSAALAVAVS